MPIKIGIFVSVFDMKKKPAAQGLTNQQSELSA